VDDEVDGGRTAVTSGMDVGQGDRTAQHKLKAGRSSAVVESR
jgi:hypothetical protein